MKIKESQLKEIIKNTLMESYGSCAWNGMPVGPKKKKKLTKSQKRARQESEEARENKNHEREMFNLMKKITESQLREIIRESITYILNEKAVSKSQQRFMGMVHAVQKGELDSDEVSDSVAKAAKSMKKKDVKDFAETKHKGLPNHVDESVNREMEEKIRKTVREMIKSGDLPKYYGKSKEPIEMAEHSTKILDKALGKESPDVVDKDFSICSSVVDDEFRKQGGKQDLDGVKNHEDSVKKDLEKIIKESIKNIIRESIDELSINTMHNAYDKMLRYGQSDRASDLGAKSWKKIYHSNIDNLTIFTNAWGINVSDPSFTSKNFIFDVEKGEWDNYPPRFSDRKAAYILAHLIQRECGEKAGEFANKQLYIK